MRRALAIDEKASAPIIPMWPAVLNNLAVLLEDQGRWPEAVALYRKAKPIMTGAHAGSEPERGGLGKAVLAQNTGNLRAYARALYRAGASDAANRARGLRGWRNGRCKTMRRMRFPPWPRGLPRAAQELGKLVREQQDLLRRARGRLSQPRCGGGQGRCQGCGSGARRHCADRGQACGEAGRAAPSLPRLRGAGQSEAACACGRASAAWRRGCAGAVSRSLANGQGSRGDDCLRAHKKGGSLDKHRPGHQRLAGARDGAALRARQQQLAGLATKSREVCKDPASAREVTEERLRLSMPPPRMRFIAICSAGSKTSSRASGCSSCLRVR